MICPDVLTCKAKAAESTLQQINYLLSILGLIVISIKNGAFKMLAMQVPELSKVSS